MGEAIIARGQTAAKNVLDDIPVSGDYCSIVVLLTDSAGGPCENTKINCKDGDRWYNYTTNEAGYVLFKCNSGAANISANNLINGIYTFDQAAVSKDYDAPVGTKKLEKISFEKINHARVLGNTSGVFKVSDSIKNLVLIGGGGGGSGGKWTDTSWTTYGGAGGGGGAKNYSESVSIVKDQLYTLNIGSGGASTKAGGTTSAFGYSANGGSGGNGIKGGNGGAGLYKGGNGAWSYYINGTQYDFNKNMKAAENGNNDAGGGGGYGYMRANMSNYPYSYTYTGSNGGGSGGTQNYGGSGGAYGSGGGGGGGGCGRGEAQWINGETIPAIWSTTGGSGGSGRIEFDM